VSETVLSPTDTPFDWGSNSSGAEALALAILTDATENSQEVDKAFQDFKREVVDRFPEDFAITQHDVLTWLRDWRKR